MSAIKPSRPCFRNPSCPRSAHLENPSLLKMYLITALQMDECLTARNRARPPRSPSETSSGRSRFFSRPPLLLASRQSRTQSLLSRNIYNPCPMIIKPRRLNKSHHGESARIGRNQGPRRSLSSRRCSAQCLATGSKSRRCSTHPLKSISSIFIVNSRAATSHSGKARICSTTSGSTMGLNLTAATCAKKNSANRATSRSTTSLTTRIGK